MGEQFKLCMFNSQFIITSIGTCCVIMHFYVFTTVIGQLVAPYGLTDQQFVIDMGLFVFGFGILGGIIFSMVLTCYPSQMLNSALLVCTAAILTLAAFFFADTKADEKGVLVACSFLGFLLLPILFNAYELAVEQTQHLGVGDTMSCGLINIFANFVGFLLAISLTPALAKETISGAWTTFIVLFANLGVAEIFLIIAKVQQSPNVKEVQVKLC